MANTIKGEMNLQQSGGRSKLFMLIITVRLCTLRH